MPARGCTGTYRTSIMTFRRRRSSCICSDTWLLRVVIFSEFRRPAWSCWNSRWAMARLIPLICRCGHRFTPWRRHSRFRVVTEMFIA